MLTISGACDRQGYFAAPVPDLRELFLDLPRLLAHVSSIEDVQSHEGGVQRILTKRLGAMNFNVWLAYDVRIEEDGDVLRARSLPYDPADPWVGEGVLLSEYASETRLRPEREGTIVEHSVEVSVHVPLPGFLQVVPLAIVKGAADALLRTELDRVLQETEDSARRQLGISLKN